MHLCQIYVFMTLMVFASSVVVRRPGKTSNVPVIGGRISDRACNQYGYNVKSRLYPYIDVDPFAIRGQFPHMASIYGYYGIPEPDEEMSFFVAGVLISPDYVLSVAHFIRNDAKKVRLGSTDATNDLSSGKVIDIQKVIPHPYFRASMKYHDISLIELSESVKFSFDIQPACLYTDPYDLKDIVMTSPGWGTDGLQGRHDNRLQIAKFSLYDREMCKTVYSISRPIPIGLNNSHICVKDKTEETAHCVGDSGSPLQFINEDNGLYTIVGISSFGKGCEPDTPTVFTNLTVYLDWIEGIVWP